MYYFCTENFFLFLYQFSRLSFTCVCLRSRFGIENVETKMRKKTLKYYSQFLTQQRWTMLLWLYDERSNRLLRSYENTTQKSALKKLRLGIQVSFSSHCMLFSRDFPSLLRAGMALSLALWWTCRNKLVFTQHNRSIRLQNVNSFQGLCYAHWVTCVLSSSFLGCKISR